MYSKKVSLLASVVCCALSACSSTPNGLHTVNREDIVLSRIDNLNERPSWLHESEPFKIENGEVLSLGSTVIPGDDRVEAALRIAENNAKAGIASGVESKLEYLFQNAEEGTVIGQDQTRFIGSEVSSLTTSALKPRNRYWEKISMTTDNGQRVTRYRVYAVVAMSEIDFKRAVLNAIRKQEGRAGISKEFAEKVNEQWDRLVDRSPSTHQ